MCRCFCKSFKLYISLSRYSISVCECSHNFCKIIYYFLYIICCVSIRMSLYFLVFRRKHCALCTEHSAFPLATESCDIAELRSIGL